VRPPVLRASFDLSPNELVVDCFAGAGGASTGIEAALGRRVDIAINHDPEAILMHRANHPETQHYCQDIHEVDPHEACGSRPVGVAWFSPDCFPAGTMILARDGYRPIEEIEVGDEILTHRLRWRRVTSTMSAIKPLLRLRGHGHPGLIVSPEHPFYARLRHDVWNNEQRGYDRKLDPEAWVRAGTLDKSWYWASPCEFPEASPPPIPIYKQRETEITPELMWIAGRYVADGWTRLTDTRAELGISCGKHKVDTFRKHACLWPRSGPRSGSNELVWHEREQRTARQFITSHRGLVEWLREHFGHGAAEKRIPGWALGMSRALREALLDGYLSGDGYVQPTAGVPLVHATTVSKALAFGLKALVATLGHSASITFRALNTNVIEGRVVNARPSWSVRWRIERTENHAQTFLENGMIWAPVRQRQDDVCDAAEVFNLSVEEDESYVADGIVVHNCTHFSRAKGSVPRSKKIRDLAWVVIRWAKAVRPRVIFLENVCEIETWGPLDKDGFPDPAQSGSTFRAWLGQLTDLGYAVEFRTLVAADYGTPTTRKRLFLIARCDGQPIVWPEPSHGEGRSLPWRPAAEIIDWSLPCPSIFLSRAQGREAGVNRPLATATLQRIAAGLRKYVFEAAEPFIIPCTHQGDSRVHGIGEPLRTVTGAHRGELALVEPFVVRHGHYSTRTGAGLREGCGAGTFRGQSLEDPLATVCATNDKHLVVPFVSKAFGGTHPNGALKCTGADARMPLSTVTARDHHYLAAAFFTKMYGTSTGASVRQPMPTITSGGGRGGGHIGEVRAFLMKYHGGSRAAGRGQSLAHPLRTVDTANRFGLVIVHGVAYRIVDIGLRMLQPHELFAAQGFPGDYIIAPTCYGKPLTKTAQTSLAGNAVPPQPAEAIVAANVRRAA
jgi:site-specific DNA-cytosine methylase